MMLRLALPALAAAFATTAAAAPAIEGLWNARDDHGVVRVAPCDSDTAKECGVLVTSDRLKAVPDARDARDRDPALRTRTLKGMPVLIGFAGGPTQWTGGKAYNPADGGTYSGTITLGDADTLRLRGCIFYPLCQTQTWTRAKSARPPAASAKTPP